MHALKDFPAHVNSHNITQGLLTHRRSLWLWLTLTLINNHNDGLLNHTCLVRIVVVVISDGVSLLNRNPSLG